MADTVQIEETSIITPRRLITPRKAILGAAAGSLGGATLILARRRRKARAAGGVAAAGKKVIAGAKMKKAWVGALGTLLLIRRLIKGRKQALT